MTTTTIPKTRTFRTKEEAERGFTELREKYYALRKTTRMQERRATANLSALRRLQKDLDKERAEHAATRRSLANLQRRYDDTAAMQREQTDYTRRLLARNWWQRLINVQDV